MQETKTPKILRYMAYVSLVITAGLLALMLYWLIGIQKPIEFPREDFIVNTPTVFQGSYLSYTVDYCKNDLLPVVSLSFVDGIIYSTPKDPQPFYEEGCHSKTFLIYIPKALPKGKYYIQHNFSFQVNPIREVNIQARTEMFEVLER